jgi:hypothetical protein
MIDFQFLLICFFDASFISVIPWHKTGHLLIFQMIRREARKLFNLVTLARCLRTAHSARVDAADLRLIDDDGLFIDGFCSTTATSRR